MSYLETEQSFLYKEFSNQQKLEIKLHVSVCMIIGWTSVCCKTDIEHQYQNIKKKDDGVFSLSPALCLLFTWQPCKSFIFNLFFHLLFSLFKASINKDCVLQLQSSTPGSFPTGFGPKKWILTVHKLMNIAFLCVNVLICKII